MVEHLHLDPLEQGPVSVDIHSTDDPALAHIKERYRNDADFLFHALTQEKRLKIDPLTGLGNISAFYEEVGPLVERAHRHPYGDQPNRFALALVDVDGLKLVNDSRGHASGNRLLRIVAASLRSQSRSFDRVYRIGGDEFAVAMPGFIIPKERKGEEVLTEKINQFETALSKNITDADFSADLPLGISVGIALLGLDDDLMSLLDRADQLMYSHKHLHRVEASQSAED